MPLEQHAIPTQVTSYEFRLVGDMTLKQFAWLAGGIILALLTYALPLPFYLKWPLILIFAIGGAATAFVPYEGRGLDRWVIAFIKASYSPTQYLWHKKNPPPNFLQTLPSRSFPTTAPLATRAEAQTRLEEYIHTLPQATPSTKLDTHEQQLLNRFAQLTSLPISSPALSPPPPNIKPSIPPTSPLKIPATTPTSITTHTSPLPTPNFKHLPPLASFSPPPPKSPPKQPPSTPSPQPLAIKVATPPSPSQPNIVVGTIIDSQKKLLENAIIEIKNSQGQAVRALKTNRLGQFAIITPLKNGSYQIEVEKDSHLFDIISFEASGEIIPPLIIQSQN